MSLSVFVTVLTYYMCYILVVPRYYLSVVNTAVLPF
eukprot:COSAG02_NODE_28493_length_588_cov_1.163599_2_plen_35_part_01